MVTGNVRPGEGTRQRFETNSKKEIDTLLSVDNIIISDNIDNTLAEIQKRFKALIFS
jgi:hypothetical protein